MFRKCIGILILLSVSTLSARESASIQATASVEPSVGVATINDSIYIIDSWNIYQLNSGITNSDVNVEYTDSTITITIIPCDI